MIVPHRGIGWPEPSAVAASEQVHASLIPPARFEARLNGARCMCLVPLGGGRLTVESPDIAAARPISRPFSLIFLPTGQKRAIVQEAAVEHLVMTIAPDRIRTVLEEHGETPEQWPDCVTDYSHPDVPAIAQAVRRHLLEPHCPTPIYLNACADLLLAHVLSRSPNQATCDAAIFSNGVLREILEEIDASLEDGPTVTALAERFGMPTAEFSRRFKATVGCNPSRYVIERRIAEARRLLAETKIPIAEIALMLGFSSQAHLTSSFKLLMGLPPGKYRRRRGQ